MKLIRSLLICLLIGSSLGAVWDSVAVKKVREGIQSFAAGEYEAARAAFDAARSAEPDNETITFDQACTLTAQGELDQAKDLFQQAALAPDRQLSSDAHYNVGNLAAVNAKETLGSDPVNVDPDKRQEVISGLLSAVGHYRDCLRIEETHPEARHNLELIRLFIKHIQAEWEQRDREQAREELGLLEFLAMIEQRQQGLRSVPALLAREKNSPHLRQALRETVDAQRQLQEEIEPLKQKLTAELQPAAAGQLPPSAQPPPQATDEQFHQIQALLDQMADDAGELMLEAADQVHAGELEAAHQTQRETLDQLNEIYMVVAPFAKVLERAIPVQEGLAQKSESMDESSESSGPPSDAGPDPDSSVDSGKPPHAGQNGSAGVEPDEAAEFSWQQSHITDWGRLLSLKAEVELPQAEAQVEEMATQAAQTPAASSDDDSAGSEQSAADADDRSSESSATHDPAAQLQALVESLRKAIELAPQVEEHSASAEQHLASSTFDQALSDQQEALRLLKEIAEPLSEQNEQNEQDKQNQQDQDENGQQDQQQDAQDQNETQQDPQNEPSDSDQQEQQEQQQKSSQERAESVLRRAREREREHRDLEKELRKILGGISPVDKDW